MNQKETLPHFLKALIHFSSVFFLVGTLLMPFGGFTQTVIGGLTPDTSAQLDVQSSNRGFLLPRMTTSQRNDIVQPAQGLMIFNITSQCLEINLGTPQAASWKGIECAGPGGILALLCDGATWTGTLQTGSPASGVSVQVPYSGGSGGAYGSQTFPSTGVSGLSAVLSGGTFTNGTGQLNLLIQGTPASSGTATFFLSIGGQSCSVQIVVQSAPQVSDTCGAYVAPGVYKEFMCYNLGAASNTLDPEADSWRLNGGYWQWGHKGPNSGQWLGTNSPNFAHGPTGSLVSQANDGGINGWSATDAPADAWQETTKTANDPCPDGFRIPTKSEWDGVLAHNVNTPIGTWTESGTNFSSGRRFGSSLFLPAAGYRYLTGGWLIFRGVEGRYWSSTPGNHLIVNNSGASVSSSSVRYGYSLRCISEEEAGEIGALNCGGAILTGTLKANLPANGASVAVPYTNGNGGEYEGQAINSTGVTGLTATLTAGSFANGTGSITLALTGVPGEVGKATFQLNIGGKSCALEVTVENNPPSADTCGAYVAPGQWLGFMCHNLGADTEADPFTPSWEINGGYWQWGRLGPDESLWKNRSNEFFANGPTGDGSSQDNDGSFSYWSSIVAEDNLWQDPYKTRFDPCPSGYRVPSKAQWEGVLANNVVENVGTWTAGSTNYTSGKFFGPNLFLPAAGYREFDDGALSSRGSFGVYWSNTPSSNDKSWRMYFLSSLVSVSDNLSKLFGFSIRCVADATPKASINTLHCNSPNVVGTVKNKKIATGVVVSVPYSGGNGGYFDALEIAGTEVEGLVARLPEGRLATGSGTVDFVLNGIPTSSGAANFEVSLGGKTCTVPVPVFPADGILDTCGAYIASGVWKAFMCHNLGAANTEADPMTPSWEINGAYFAKNRSIPPASQWQTSNTTYFIHGPTGSALEESNFSGVLLNTLSGYSNYNYNPCPEGYRLPSVSEWQFISNYSKVKVGTWTSSPTNYSSGYRIGSSLFLPAAGYRNNGGTLSDRGVEGRYWAQNGGDDFLRLTSSNLSWADGSIYEFYSVRCMAE